MHSVHVKNFNSTFDKEISNLKYDFMHRKCLTLTGIFYIIDYNHISLMLQKKGREREKKKRKKDYCNFCVCVYVYMCKQNENLLNSFKGFYMYEVTY